MTRHTGNAPRASARSLGMRARQLFHAPRHVLRRIWRPGRPIVQRVQDVEMWMPRSHTLPYFSAVHRDYGQNLVQVAKVAAEGASLRMIDIGANIGDSALQVAAQVDSEILCIEGDPLWARFLRMNASSRPRLTVEECFVLVGDTPALRLERHGGTSQLVPHVGGEQAGAMSTPGALLARHAGFRDVRLIKSDTDGFDTALIVAFAEECRSSAPVLFFEYDPALARKAGDPEPQAVWQRLADLGYVDVFVWDNFGRPKRSVSISVVGELSGSLEGPRSGRDHDYWDVAVVHSRDSSVSVRLRRLMPAPVVSDHG